MADSARAIVTAGQAQVEAQEAARVAEQARRVAERARLEAEALRAAREQSIVEAEQVDQRWEQVQTAPANDYEAYIYEIAPQYGVNPADMIRVMYCESSGDPLADNGICEGLFQFNPGTWASTPEAGSSIWDGYAQIRATAWMWSVGRRGEWACQ